MRHVLVIEISSTLRHALQKMLTTRKHKVTPADSYENGLNLLKDIVNGTHQFDGVIIGWPEKTDNHADEILVFLSSADFKNMPIILLSDEGDPAKLDWITNRPKTALLPWSDYEECADALDKLVTSSVDESSNRLEVIPEQTIRVLLVDDSPTVRFNFRRLLTDNGYIVEAASSVNEAIELAVKNPFDIAIIDYFMPEANGDVLVRKLRANPNTQSIVSTIITGTYSDQVIRDCLDAGAVECMFKNEANELFLARVRSLSRAILDRKSIDNERKRLERILRSVGDGVYGVNKDGVIEFVNPATNNILGYANNELIGQSSHSLFHYAVEDGTATTKEACFLSQCYKKGSQLTSWQTVFWHKSGHSIPVDCTAYPMEVEGEHVGSVVAFRDVSDRKLFEEELRWQATHDTLTKLLNRTYFESQLEDEVHRLKRSDQRSALLFVDLDRFKYINDTAGHAVGDHILIEAGHRLQSRLRASDTLARIGGDEYAIILRNLDAHDDDEILSAADGFRRVLEERKFFCAGKSYSMTMTSGVAILDNNTKSPGEAMANADIACHIAKNNGRNLTHIYSEEQDKSAAMDIELG